MLELREEKEKLGEYLDTNARELEALKSRLADCEEDVKEKSDEVH